jgi:hypothetical protein
MRLLHVPAAIALFALLPAMTAAAAPSWAPATAMSVTAYAEHSDFLIDAYLSVPNACYAARIRTDMGTSGRVFFVEQMKSPSATACSPSPYKCTIISAPIPLPIPQSIAVTSQNKKWKVHVLTEHEPAPMQPMCRKS